MVHAGVHVVSSGSLMTELLSSGAADMVQWIDKYLPTIGYIKRAHGHAVQTGVIEPAMEEVL